MNDGQLLSAYVQGDQQAFEDLVRKYFSMVFSAAVRQVTDRGLAEEIAQSVFILLARKAAGLSPQVVLTGWLLRTTRFVARDALKQATRRQIREQQATERAAMEQEEDPTWAALAPLVDEALLALPHHEQACVVARFLQGRSFREIGTELGITEDTAQKRVSRSLDKMRAFLARRGLTTATTAIAGLLSVDFAKAAAPEFVKGVLSAVKAAGANPVMGNGSIALADSAARGLAWRYAGKVALSITVGATVLVSGVLILVRQADPLVPGNAPFQISDNRIEMLGRAWSGMAVLAAELIRAYPGGQPPPGDPRAGSFQRESERLSQESAGIVTQLNAALATRVGPARADALAELLTVELRENVGLTPRQQAAVYTLLRTELNGGGFSALLQNRTAIGPRIQARLSPAQRQRFLHIYAEDYRGLFAVLYLVQPK